MITEQKTNLGTRIGAMLFDLFAMTFISMILLIPTMISPLEVTHEQSGADMFGTGGYSWLLLLALYFCKDCINGRSLAKRALKLQVIEKSGERVASPLRCFVRNIFIIIWPVEVIATLINPGRRIGDYVAGTKVVVFDPEREKPGLNPGQLAVSFVLACGLAFLAMLPSKLMTQGWDSEKVTWVESSINEQAARETEKLLADSLGTYLTADVRVYDEVAEVKDIKYISVILRLKEDIMADESDFIMLHSSIVSLLFSKFPENTFTGQIKYVYQAPGIRQVRVWPLTSKKNNEASFM